MPHLHWFIKAAAATFTLSLGLFGCRAPESEITSSIDTSARQRFLMLVAPTSPTLQAFRDGATEKAKELDVELVWMDVGESALGEAQITTLKSLNSAIGCIIVQPADRASLEAVLKHCESRGTPFVLAWAGMEPELAATHVGGLGREVGVALAESIIASEPKEPAEIGFVRLEEESPFVAEAARQCRTRLRATLNLDVVEGKALVSGNEETATSACLQLIQEWQDPEGNFLVRWIVCPDAASAEAMVKALKAKNALGKVNVASLEPSSALIDAVRSGGFQALVVYDAYASGEAAVQNAYDYLRGANPMLYDYVKPMVATPKTIQTEAIQSVLAKWQTENEAPSPE